MIWPFYWQQTRGSVAGTGGPGDPLASYLVFARFTGANGTNLTAYTPDKAPGSNKFGAGLGTWQITSNKAVLGATDGDGQNVSVIDAGEADVDASVEVTVGATFDARLVVNYVDQDNFWMGAFTHLGWALYRRLAGDFTAVDTDLEARGAGTYTLRIVTSGPDGEDIAFLIDGVEKYSDTIGGRAHADATKHGISVFVPDDPGSGFDNFRILPS